jgi:hypothetical protein
MGDALHIEKLSSVLTGVAGEYFVAAELTRRGYIASITLRNTRGVDILCSNMDASRSVGIQVKTSRYSNRDWMLNKKAENYFADNLFYVFVNLNDNKKEPEYFIVPSETVASYIRESHSTWLKTPGRKGQDHKDTTMRRFKDFEEKYKDRWEILGL